MDINFLKHLSPNVGYLFPKHRITLSSTPSVDLVNVGVCQVVRHHSLYVPIYGRSPLHTIKKVITQPCQYGGSNDKLLQDQTNDKSPISNDVEIQFLNNKKRKMAKGVVSSFDHPVIQTSTLSLFSSSESPTPKKSKGSKINYKFKVID